MLELFAKWYGALRKFRANEAGNVVVIFALSLVPVMGSVGAAVDYSHANSIKAAMQAAVDATAMAMSQTAASMTADALQLKSTDYFKALFSRPEAVNVTVKTTLSTTGGSSLIVAATGNMKTNFMGMMGFPTLRISASSTAAWGNIRLRVALALDNTGSMAAANKMTALKSAAKSFLGQLQNAATQNGDVYVSIIPFAEDVNVDPAKYGNSWVRWDLWDEVNGACSSSSYKTKSSCVANSKTWNTTAHNKWNGCITDRDQPNDTTNTAPASSQIATLFPAEQYGFTFGSLFLDWCPVPILELTYDWTAMKNKIDAMQPNGFTNQAIGLQWAFQSLTSAPFTIPTMDSKYQYQQVIVLFTDGLNTSDRWYPYGVSTSEASIDARQKITCDNIKAAGITIYTVQISTDGEPSSALLKGCASDPGKFFFMTNASDLVTIFTQIGTNLSRLRLAK